MLKPKTVDGVLSQFGKLRDQLDVVIAAKADERDKHEAAIIEAQTKRLGCVSEIERAERVRERIAEFTA